MNYNKEIETRNLRAGAYIRRKLQEKEDRKINDRWEFVGWTVMAGLMIGILIAVIALG
jgi:hypothetical protein